MIFILLLALVGTALTVPLGPEDPAQYLVQFGYLEDDGEQGRTAGSDEFYKAVCDFQDFNGLEITCMLDEATLDKMASPRCGVQDVMPSSQARYLVASAWDHNDITYKRMNYNQDLYWKDVDRILPAALQKWADVTPLTFTKAGYFDDADIEISFVSGDHGDGYPFDGIGGTLAHAFSPGAGIGGDTHFDEDESFTEGTDEGTDLFIVALHEFGHALGLYHSDVSTSVMAAYYPGYVADLELTDDDIRGIQSLYGSN